MIDLQDLMVPSRCAGGPRLSTEAKIWRLPRCWIVDLNDGDGEDEDVSSRLLSAISFMLDPPWFHRYVYSVIEEPG